MDPGGPWSTYTSYNRLAGVQASAAASGDLHHHLTSGVATTPGTGAQALLPGSFLSPGPVGYETVFPPLFHPANAKPSSHYVTQHRQALVQAQAVAVAKQSDSEYHQAQAFFEQNPNAWQQNSPFGVLPHESVVATTTAKAYENFNAHFAAQSINHLNSLVAKNATLRTTSPQVVNSTKPQTNASFFQTAPTFPSTEASSTTNKPFVTNAQNIQQTCIVTSSNTSTNLSISKDYRVPQTPTRPVFLSTTSARVEKTTFPKQTPAPAPQIQTKAQTKIYPDLISQTADRQHQQHRNNEEQNQQNSPISYSINYSNANANSNNKRPYQGNYRHYPQSVGDGEFSRKDFNNANVSPDCNVVIPRRPSPLQAHSQASPIGHAPSPVYPLYNSPMNSAISSPQGNQVTSSSPLDASVARPTSQNNVAYSSVITRTLNSEKVIPDRFDRQASQNCWDDRRKFNNNYNNANTADISSRQTEAVPRQEHRQHAYFDSTNHVPLQDLSSCRGDPMTIVKNLQQQQGCSVVQQPVIKLESKDPVKRRKSNDKPGVTNDLGRIPPPAHTSEANQQVQNGAYFDFDRWNLPPPAPSKMFTSQGIQQHQGLMVPHPHTHHPSLPYFTPFHLAPHPPEFAASVELSVLPSYEQNDVHIPQYHQQQPQQPPQTEDQPKVVVPNIEEELDFLTNTNQPLNVPKNHEVKKSGAGAGFMSSYIKFLQGERDSSPPPPSRGRKQTWSRTKIEIKPVSNTNGATTTLPPQPPPRLTQGDPQDDPRYFPLPKERKNNSFNSSDDGISSDDDLFNKKVPQIIRDPIGKDRKRRKGRTGKSVGSSERKKARQTKSKVKDVAEKEDFENVPRRESSKRAAKERINMALIKDDEELADFADSDSDPAWTPTVKEECDEEVTHKRSKRGKKRTPKSLDVCTDELKSQRVVVKTQKHNERLPLEDNFAAAIVKQNNSLCEENPFKVGEFVVIKSELSQQWPSIWRIDGKSLLQKYEAFDKDGRVLYRNISTYTSWTPESKKLYLAVPIKYISQNHLENIVEFLRNEMIYINPAFVEQTMKESESYQDNFEVYIQTLISQALDSNFLTEIFQEQDDYFLTNVKTIDDITSSKRQKLVDCLKWPPIVIGSISTCPCFNITTEFNTDVSNSNCAACGIRTVAIRVFLYGQPYKASTLEGCPPDPKAVNEKSFLMCRICGNKVEILSKITHQKYTMYIECAKRVTEKRNTDSRKDTTAILNELLADEFWLTQLFANVRNLWAEIDSIEVSYKQNSIESVI